MLEDYTHLADGLLALYEATFDERWFATARALMDRVLARFADPAGGFFDTADDHERLVTRPKDVQDNAVPSGNAMAAQVLLRLAAWTGEGRVPRCGRARDADRRAVRRRAIRPGFAQWLSAMDLALAPAVEVAIVGDPDDAGDRGAARRGRERGFRPNQVVAVSADPGASVVPLLADRVAIDGRPTAYVCRGFVCRLPVTDAERLARDAARGRAVTEPGRGPAGGDRRPAALRAGPAWRSCWAAGRRRWRSPRTSTSSRAAGSTRPTPTRAWSRGPSSRPRTRRRALGGDLPPTEAIAAFIAAIRESFEEAGVLLADVGPGSSPGALRAARAALVGGEIGFQALAAQLDLTLRTDLARPALALGDAAIDCPRRFDARFFAAELPDGARASFEGDEVVEHAWLRPADALEAMADGRLAMWLPTSTTLQQLEHVRAFEEVRARLAPGRSAQVEVDEVGRGRDPDRHAGRWRRRRPARLRLSRRPALVRARRSGRPDGPGARTGDRAGRRSAAARSGRSR